MPALALLPLAPEQSAFLSDARAGEQVGSVFSVAQASWSQRQHLQSSLPPPDLGSCPVPLTVVGDKRQQIPELPAGHTFI